MLLVYIFTSMLHSSVGRSCITKTYLLNIILTLIITARILPLGLFVWTEISLPTAFARISIRYKLFSTSVKYKQVWKHRSCLIPNANELFIIKKFSYSTNRAVVWFSIYLYCRIDNMLYKRILGSIDDCCGEIGMIALIGVGAAPYYDCKIWFRLIFDVHIHICMRVCNYFE